MYLEISLADFAVFHVFLGISRDFAEIPEFRGSATARNIRRPALTGALVWVAPLKMFYNNIAIRFNRAESTYMHCMELHTL